VEQRLPQEPMVLKPLRSVGKYGGTWRRGFLGPGDSENGNRVRSSDKLLFWDVTGTKITPNAAKGFEISADGRRTTLFLRKGMKWSDGAPFTADDFMFWYQDMYQNKDLIKSPAPELSANGKAGRMSKLDETPCCSSSTIRTSCFRASLPATRRSAAASRGCSRRSASSASMHRHIISSSSCRKTPRRGAQPEGQGGGLRQLGAGVQDQVRLAAQPDVPTIAAWRMVQPINTQTWVLERNAYFWTVDTAGNQLPYLDKVQLTLAENPEVINLRAIAGEYDYMERFIDLAKLPVFLENAARGKYKVHLRSGLNGSDSELKFNFAYRLDAEIQKWFAKCRLPPRAGARHRPRTDQRGVLPRPRRLRHADPGRHHCGEPRQGVAS